MKELELIYNSENQEIAFNNIVNNDVRMLLLQGGANSGKTFIVMRAIFIRAFNMPGSLHYLFKTNLGVLCAAFERNVLNWLDESGLQPLYNYDKSKHILSLFNKAKIYLCPIVSPTPKTTKDNSILGFEAETIYIDEATSLVFEWWEFFLSRCRSARGYNSLMIASENPDARSWSYSYFVKKIHPKTLQDLPVVIKDQLKVLRIEAWDNVFTEALFLDIIKNSGDVDRFYYGRVNEAIDFNQIYQYEVDEYSDRLFQIYGIDPGWSVETGIVEIGFGGDYQVNVRELFYEKGLSSAGYFKEVEKIIRIHNEILNKLLKHAPLALRSRLLYIQVVPHIIVDCARTDLIHDIDDHFNKDIKQGELKKVEVIACNKSGSKAQIIRKVRKLKQVVDTRSKFYLSEINNYMYQPKKTEEESIPDGNDHLLDASLYCMRYILEEMYEKKPFTLLLNNDLKAFASYLNI